MPPPKKVGEERSHKVVGVEEIIDDGDPKSLTLDYMRKFGWENVRGFFWKQWDMKNPPREL